MGIEISSARLCLHADVCMSFCEIVECASRWQTYGKMFVFHVSQLKRRETGTTPPVMVCSTTLKQKYLKLIDR